MVASFLVRFICQSRPLVIGKGRFGQLARDIMLFADTIESFAADIISMGVYWPRFSDKVVKAMLLTGSRM